MAKLIKFELLEAAEVLSIEIGYRQAAQRLGISQAVLRKMIATLEEQLEFQIFEKEFKQVQVTPEGRAFLNASQAFLKEVKGIRSSKHAEPDTNG